jgi:hypothetical protein
VRGTLTSACVPHRLLCDSNRHENKQCVVPVAGNGATWQAVPMLRMWVAKSRVCNGLDLTTST